MGARPLGHGPSPGRAHRYLTSSSTTAPAPWWAKPPSSAVHVKMYQGVGLVARSLAAGQQLRGKKRHPTVEDDVTIYAGATIVGGDHRGWVRAAPSAPTPFSRTACPRAPWCCDDVKVNGVCPKKPSNRRLQTGRFEKGFFARFLPRMRPRLDAGWDTAASSTARFGQASSTNPDASSTRMPRASISSPLRPRDSETAPASCNHAQCEESRAGAQSASPVWRNRLAAPRCGAFDKCKRPSAALNTRTHAGTLGSRARSGRHD